MDWRMTAALLRPRPAVGRAEVDRAATTTRLAMLGVAGGIVLRVVGVPRVDLHGPLHYLGIMDPFCGGTRAMFLLTSGHFSAAAKYNPIVFPSRPRCGPSSHEQPSNGPSAAGSICRRPRRCAGP
jgi:hypothetical protein